MTSPEFNKSAGDALARRDAGKPRTVPVYLARADWLRVLRATSQSSDPLPVTIRLRDAIEHALGGDPAASAARPESQQEGK